MLCRLSSFALGSTSRAPGPVLWRCCKSYWASWPARVGPIWENDGEVSSGDCIKPLGFLVRCWRREKWLREGEREKGWGSGSGSAAAERKLRAAMCAQATPLDEWTERRERREWAAVTENELPREAAAIWRPTAFKSAKHEAPKLRRNCVWKNC